jgi:antitoxin ParD1/3/4
MSHTTAGLNGSGNPRGRRPALVVASQSTYIFNMNIILPPAQQQWLEAKIAKGEFASVEQAVQHMIAERMAIETDDLAWAKPYVDQARAAVVNGDAMTLEEHQARMAKRLKAFER